MLDMYYIFDSEYTPDYPVENNYIASLSLEQFKDIKRAIFDLNEHNIVIDFFTDCRLKSAEVDRAYKYISSKNYSNYLQTTSAKQSFADFKKILKKAMDKRAGIMCFCD